MASNSALYEPTVFSLNTLLFPGLAVPTKFSKLHISPDSRDFIFSSNNDKIGKFFEYECLVSFSVGSTNQYCFNFFLHLDKKNPKTPNFLTELFELDYGSPEYNADSLNQSLWCATFVYRRWRNLKKTCFVWLSKLDIVEKPDVQLESLSSATLILCNTDFLCLVCTSCPGFYRWLRFPNSLSQRGHFHRPLAVHEYGICGKTLWQNIANCIRKNQSSFVFHFVFSLWSIQLHRWANKTRAKTIRVASTFNLPRFYQICFENFRCRCYDATPTKHLLEHFYCSTFWIK